MPAVYEGKASRVIVHGRRVVRHGYVRAAHAQRPGAQADVEHRRSAHGILRGRCCGACSQGEQKHKRKCR